MNNVQVYNNAEFGAVRAMEIDGEPYFVGKDVAEILGYANSRKALADHVDDEDKTDGVTIRDSIGRDQTPVLINESGLYSLILSSKLPSAKRFKRWVTAEVLPSIRKTGGYSDIKQKQAEIRQMSEKTKQANALLKAARFLTGRARTEAAAKAAEIVLGYPLSQPIYEVSEREHFSISDAEVEAIGAYLSDKTEICIIDIWQNALNRGGKPSRQQSNEISNVLACGFPEWHRQPNPKRFKSCGLQKYWAKYTEPHEESESEKEFVQLAL